MKSLKRNKIKFKVKHLIYVILTFLVFIPNLIIFIASTCYTYDFKNPDAFATPKNYYMQGFLNLYVNMPKISNKEAEAYYYMAINEYDYLRDDLYYLSQIGFASDNMYISEGGIEKAIEYHLKGFEIGEKNKDEFYMRNAFGLISLYYQISDYEKAYDICSLLVNDEDEKIKSYGYLNKGILDLKLRSYDEGIKAFETMDGEYIKLKDRFLGDIYRLKGNNKKVAEYYAKNEYEYMTNIGATRLRGSSYDIYSVDYIHPPQIDLTYSNVIDNKKTEEELVSLKKDIYKNNVINDEFRGNIKGTFKYNDDSMNGSIIILSKDKLSYGPQWGIGLMEESYFFAYVDRNGEFEFNNIIEGPYSINIIIPKNKKIEAGIPGIALGDYRVNVERGNTINLDISKNGNLDNTEITDIEVVVSNNSREILNYSEAYKKPILDDDKVIFEKDTENNELNKYYIPIEFEDRIMIFEDEKNKKIELYKDVVNMWNFNGYSRFGVTEEINGEIFNSSPFYGLIEEDKLTINYSGAVYEYINKSDYESVLKYYEDEYAKDKTNEFTLKILIKLYTTGTDTLGNNKDVNKAIRLSDELYDIHKSSTLDWQVKDFIYRNFFWYLYNN